LGRPRGTDGRQPYCPHTLPRQSVSWRGHHNALGVRRLETDAKEVLSQIVAVQTELSRAILMTCALSSSIVYAYGT